MENILISQIQYEIHINNEFVLLQKEEGVAKLVFEDINAQKGQRLHGKTELVRKIYFAHIYCHN